MVCNLPLVILGHLSWLCPHHRSCLPSASWWGGMLERQLWCCGQLLSSSQSTGVLPTPFQLPLHSTALWGLLWGKLAPSWGKPAPSQPDPVHRDMTNASIQDKTCTLGSSFDTLCVWCWRVDMIIFLVLEKETGFVLPWTKGNAVQLIFLPWLCCFRDTVLKLCFSDCRFALTSFLPKRILSHECVLESHSVFTNTVVITQSFASAGWQQIRAGEGGRVNEESWVCVWV